MDLQERINILTQGAEIAQKNGVLTLDDAYVAKQAIDALKNNILHKTALEILINTAVKGQKNGVYSLKDAHLLYLASENIESVIPAPAPAVQKPPVQQPEQTTATPVEKKTKTKKES